MFWENEYTYDVIDNEVSLDNLKDYLKENNINMDLSTNNNQWAAFASYRGHKHGFNPFKCASYANMVASYMTGMPCSASTEIYYDEEKIDNNILEAYNKLNNGNTDEEVKLKSLFKFIFVLYNDPDFEDKFEWKNDIIHVRLGLSDSLKLETFPGKNDSERIRYAIRRE